MLISIIIPVYNKRETLLRSIESVEKNIDVEHELILVDDESTDGCREILESLSHRYLVIFQKNAGPSVARNVGARNAKGDILLFIDADDTLTSDALAVHSRALENPAVDVSIGGNVMVTGEEHLPVVPFAWFIDEEDNNGIRIVRRFSALLMKGIAVDCVAVRKEAFWRVGGFNESLRCWEISEFQMRLLVSVDAVALAEKITSYQYCNPDNSLYAKHKDSSEHSLAVATAMIGLLRRVPPEERQFVAKLIATFLYCLVRDGKLVEYKRMLRNVEKEAEAGMRLETKQRLIVLAPDWLLFGLDKYHRSGRFA